MSVTSCDYQVTLVKDGSSITAALMSVGGDLFQRYSGTAASPTGITPDWSAATNPTLGSGPIIRIVLMDTDPTVDQSDLAGMVVDSETKWYVDDLEIIFDSNGLSMLGTQSGQLQKFAGCFRKLTAAAGANHVSGAPCGGLEIRGNLVAGSQGHSLNIKCVVALNNDGAAMYTQGGTTIRMIRVTGESNFATIYCDSSDSFVLDSANPSVECKVRCWRGNGEVASANFTRKWYLMRQGQWGSYNPGTDTFTPGTPQATTDTLTVTQDMINTFGDVKVECYDGDGNLIASDIQTVNDVEDPYVLQPNPSPADGRFYINGGPEKITFSPKVVDREGVQQTGMLFIFTVVSLAGVTLYPLNGGTHTPSATFDLMKSVVTNEGDDVVVIIEAVTQ